MSNSQKIEVGNRVEYQPSGRYIGSKHAEETATVLRIEGREAKVRFEDGDEVWIMLSLLVWLPTQAEFEASKAAIWADHLKSMAERDGGDCGPKRGGLHITMSRSNRRAKFKPD